MIGAWSGGAGTFLQVTAVLVFLFALPMLLTPLTWARALGWSIPPGDTSLAVYFGRCLGGVVCVLSGFAVVASERPEVQPFFFQLMVCVLSVNIAIHLYGALRRVQPLSETLEIGAWALLLLGALAGCGRSAPLAEPPRACVFDRDCAEGLRCVNGQCQVVVDAGSRQGWKQFGEPCELSEECASGYCLGGPRGAFCSTPCEGECPSGYS